jgi:branched-chain amino acid transport system permease protein
MSLANPQENVVVSNRRLSVIVELMARHRVAAVLGFLLVFPFLLPYEALAVNILIYGLYALGFNMVFGYMGVLSFGHAAFFGMGSYAAGIVIAHYGLHWLAALAIGVVAAGICAAIIGGLATRTRGIYFAMVTLALSQCVYYLVYQMEDLSGGENGLRGVDVHKLGIPGLELTLIDPLTKYYFVFAFVALAVWLFSRILASPFGAVLEAIRENENRARACGIDVMMSKWLAFVISGMFCGLAGALNAIHLSIVPIESLHYHTSGLAVMMSLLGGMGTFFGPFVGAMIFLVLEDAITLVTVHWQLFVGALFVFFILFFPRGVWGTFLHWAAR